MTDEMNAAPGPSQPADAAPTSESPAAIVDKIATFGRTHMPKVVGLMLPAAGILALFYSFYLAFDLLTHDWLELRDVIVATLGMLAAVFIFAVLLGLHGFRIFGQARKNKLENTYHSSTILRALAGAARGFGESFLVGVVVAIPFFGLQALIAERDAPLPLFGEGFVGVLLAPLVYAIFMLLFCYLSAELIENWVGLREDKAS